MPAADAPSAPAALECGVCAEAGMSVGVTAAVALVMLVIGFLIGTRARQLLAVSKVLGEAMRSFTIRIPPPADSDDKGDDGGDDDQLDDDEGNLSGLVEDFLSNDTEQAFEDHPELQLNPVFLYQIRVFKEKQKEEKALEQRRLLLEADGLSVEEIAAKMIEMEDDAAAGGARTNDKQCALNVLIDAGARVTALAASGGAEAAALQDRRRQQRNIEIFLRQTRDIVTEKVKGKTRNNKGQKVATASEVAEATGRVRFGAGTFEREIRNVPVAKMGRGLLREWKKGRDYLRAARGEEDPEEWDEASDGEQRNKDIDDVGARRQRGGATLNQAELMKLAAELGQDMDDDDDEDDPEEDV